MSNVSRIFKHENAKVFIDKYTGIRFTVREIRSMLAGDVDDPKGQDEWLERFVEPDEYQPTSEAEGD